MNDALRDKVTAALGKHENATSIITELNTEFNTLKSVANAEKTKGVNSTKALQDLQTSHNSIMDELKGLNYDPSTGVQGLIDAAKGKPNESDGNKDLDIENHPAFKKLNYDFEQMKESNKAKDDKLLEANNDAKNNQLKSKLTNAFKNDKGENTHTGISYMVDNLVNNNKLKLDDNNNIYWKNPKEELDTSVNFETGFKAYLETPDVMELRKSNQNGGSGSSSQGGGNDDKNIKDDLQRIRKARSFTLFK